MATNGRESMANIYDALIQSCSKSLEDGTAGADFLKKSSVALVQLKTLNRNLQFSLDNQRKEIEAKKSTVDKLQLNLENFLYRQAYLKRDIQEYKSTQTPNLEEIEREIGCQLGTKEYSPNLEEITQRTIEALNSEKESRLAAQADLSAAKVRNKAVIAVLDKKRKFLDDLPLKMKQIKAATAELESQFQAITAEISAETDGGNSNGVSF